MDNRIKIVKLPMGKLQIFLNGIKLEQVINYKLHADCGDVEGITLDIMGYIEIEQRERGDTND